MTYYVKTGSTIQIADEADISVSNSLDVGVYTVTYNEMTKQYGLESINPFDIPSKLYGDTEKNTTRILNTFKDRPSTTGVLLSGEKGSGKSLLAKNVCANGLKQGIPIIVVNEPYCGTGFNKFIQDVDTECIIFIDEFEKMYDREDQEKLLTLLDGSFNSKKLFILTCNNVFRTDIHMRNRPGRIYYYIEYKGVSPDFIREYCEDNLKNLNNIEGVVTAGSIFDEFNFDMLKAMVEEMNRYGETASDVMQILNTKPYQDQHDSKMIYEVVKLVIDDKEIDVSDIDPIYNAQPFNKNVFIDVGLVFDEYSSIEFFPSEIVNFDRDTKTYTYEKGSDVMVIQPKLINNSIDFTKFMV
jgi:hypothetical protein